MSKANSKEFKVGLNVIGFFIDDCQTDNLYFASTPRHKSHKAQLALNAMGHEQATSLGLCDTLLDGLQPLKGQMTIGAYDHGAFLSDYRFLEHLANGHLERLVAMLKPVMDLYSESRSLAWHVYDKANAYGFAYFENGNLIRAMAGNELQYIVTNYGNPLPEESNAHELFTPVVGVESTLALTSRFWGDRSRTFLNEKLELEIFEL